MSKISNFLQLLAWFFAACYFALMTADKLQVKPVKNDIVAQLEQQVNFTLENEE